MDWKSDLSLETVFSAKDPLSYPTLWKDGILYLSQLGKQKGRAVLIYQVGDRTICITPNSYNLGSKFSEYGGKPYWLNGDDLIFVNKHDQCLYRQHLDHIKLLSNNVIKPIRVSPLPTEYCLLMYADLVFFSDKQVVCIVEEENRANGLDRENESFIALIDLEDPESKAQTLLKGADFYNNLCLDKQRNRLTWVQWNHPNMPWNETQLWLADLDEDTRQPNLLNVRRVLLHTGASVCQCLLAKNGKLFFSADFPEQTNSPENENRPEYVCSPEHIASSALNYWNIYVVDPSDENLAVQAITSHTLEFGYPHWQYGDARIVQLDDDNLLTIASSIEDDWLFKIDQNSFKVESIIGEKFGYRNLSTDTKGSAVAIKLSIKASPKIVQLDEFNNGFIEVSSSQNDLHESEVSIAEHFEFSTSDSAKAYGFYYPPKNSLYGNEVEDGKPPPLIVMVHGGPTAKADGFYDVQKQFWTQRGFALFDVNHRGSVGYGRKYRDALNGCWGVLDTQDIVDGVKHLISIGKADAQRICIRGKSAGGYAVLRALTEYPTLFRAGASYYGIGNLVTLAETTHKFEKHYTDSLIGESYQISSAAHPNSKYQSRSPINKISELQSAMIVFQGLDDKVVPPTVAHEIIKVLKKLGLEYSYVEYAEEGHGFKQSENNIDALSRELEFYQSNLTCKNEPN